METQAQTPTDVAMYAELESLNVEAEDGNTMVLKAIRVSNKRESGDDRQVSRAMPEDAFKGDYAGDVIEPPFDLFVLATMEEQSSILGPCLDAMSINIESLGHRIVPRDKIAKVQADEMSTEIESELATVDNFFANAVLEGTLIDFRKKLRRDLESTGNAYIEVVPGFTKPDEPMGMNHIPSWTTRLCHMDKEPTWYEVPRAVREGKDKWAIKKFPHRKNFRKFVQRKDYSGEKVYFKEWGDPRVIDYKTGKVLAESWEKSSKEQRNCAANPVIHLKLYCPRSPYGLPRFIGNLFTVYGNREAEKINYTTLKCNNVPALLMMVTNAQLTSGSIKRIREFVEERIQGDNNYSTILIVEAEPISEGMKDPGTMKMEVTPLTENQHTDAMFVKYMDRNDEKVRQSFRLPPIFLGLADEYNRATADASRKLAEEQVFLPERNTIDSVFNTTLVPALGAASVLFRSNTPNVTDNYELTQLLAVAERSGGLSPHISRVVVEDVLGRDLPDVDPSIEPHIPFTLTMLREQLKAQTDSDGNVEKILTDAEVLQQLKMLKGLMDQSGTISAEAHKAVTTLIAVMEAGGYADDVTMGMKSCGCQAKGGAKEEEIDPLCKTIRQEGDQWCVYSEDGETNFGCYDTKEEAEDRLGQIEGFSEKFIQFRHFYKSDTDGERHIIGGAVLVPGTVDLQGDTYDADTTEAAAHFWLEHYGDGDEYGIKLMHQGKVIFDAARPIESYVLGEDTTFKVDVSAASEDHPSQELDKITYPKGTWMLFAKVLDGQLWNDAKSGEYLGWSIGGVALVRELKRFLKRQFGTQTLSQ